jgi:cation diffusion facilitator family transporter
VSGQPLLSAVRAWFGFGPPDSSLPAGAHSGHSHHGGKDHGHTHGVIDPTIATTARGIWAVKWSFVILAITAAFQFAIVMASGSVALLADMIHNVGDAVTAIPLWIAFMLARRKPSPRFTYGYGRTEDLAGVAIVLIILVSALVAAYEAIDRLIHPHTIVHLVWIALAGLIGFLGNESVAVFRIRTGRQINSAALIADGYHARTDGLTSLAVVVGAAGVRLGYPLADPIIGLLITLAIFAIVWQSAKAVFTRMLDGVEPEITAEIRHAAGHVSGIRQVLDVRARWLGHRLHAELDVAVDGDMSVSEANDIAENFEDELFEHIPALAAARIRVRPYDAAMPPAIEHADHGHGHHHAPEPVEVRGELAEGIVEIIDTPAGERLRFTAARSAPGLAVVARIQREGNQVEVLELLAESNAPKRFLSSVAPEEPHEFDARLCLKAGDRSEALPFSVVEPPGYENH